MSDPPAPLGGGVLGYLCASRSALELKINNLGVDREYRRRPLGRLEAYYREEGEDAIVMGEKLLESG